MAAVADGINIAFNDMGHSVVESLGLASSGFEGFVQAMAHTVIDLISQMMAASISQAVAGATASGTATGPAAVFTTPAFITSAVAGVLSAFAAIPKFEFGGVVPGTSFSGDKILARLNSGEEILRRDDPRHRNNQMRGIEGARQSVTINLAPAVQIGYRGINVGLREDDYATTRRR